MVVATVRPSDQQNGVSKFLPGSAALCTAATTATAAAVEVVRTAVR